MIKLNQIKIGDKVLLRPDFGSGKPIKVTISGIEEDIKNGFAGIEYDDTDGDLRWAYLDQIYSILKD